MINIVNKYTHTKTENDVYCGRGSALGNPFTISDKLSRGDVCDMYGEQLNELVSNNKLTQLMRNQLNKIYKLAKLGDVNLVCYCSPKRCHCESIKALVESKLKS